MTVGSHPVLVGLGDDALVWELENSKRAIEREPGNVRDAIAYPLGWDQGYSVSGTIAVDRRVRLHAAAAAYLAGCTYIPGIARIGEDDPPMLYRVGGERYLSRSECAGRLSMPGVLL